MKIIAKSCFFTAVLLSLSFTSCTQKSGQSHSKQTTNTAQTGPAIDAFSSEEPLAFMLEADFKTPFRAARAGNPDGIFPQPRVKDPFTGLLNSAQVEMKLRGNSSLQECSFPKLTIKSKIPMLAQDTQLPKKFKLGTHCGEDDANQQGTIGRLRNETAAWREALAYDLARGFGIETLRTRKVNVTYKILGTEPQTITRQGFILEHMDEFSKRMAGTSVDAETITKFEVGKFDFVAAQRIRYFHALLGNWDWTLETKNEKKSGSIRLWNTEVYARANGELVPVPADFDLSSFVTGDLSRSKETKLKATAKDKALVEDLLTRKVALLKLIETAHIDETGRTNATAHVEAFYAKLKK